MRYGSVLLMLVLAALACRSQTITQDPRESQPPRRLSDTTKNELAACLNKKSGHFTILSIANKAEAYRYAEDWREVFLSAGWQTERKDLPIDHFRIVGGMWHGMRVGIHDGSSTEGETAPATDTPEGNFVQCVNGRRDIPPGGRIMRYKDKATGSISIQISDQQ